MSIQGSEKLSASLEDYLEAIYNLSEVQKVARSKEIAQSLGVSQASVTSALQTLSEKGLVNYKPYGYITLTDRGHKLAARVAGRHDILMQFFADVLGVNVEKAHEVACRAEHAMGPDVTSRLTMLVDFLSQPVNDGGNLVQQFQNYWKRINED